MAPFDQAVKVTPTSSGEASSIEGKRATYEGVFDPTWNVGNVPCGGYAMALILEACIQHQAKTPHIDPLHITAHFLGPTDSTAPFDVQVQTLKSGKGFSNLTAELVQGDSLKITAHAIFGVNSSTSDDGFVLRAPSSYARRIPLHIHPSQAAITPVEKVWTFNGHTSWAYDTETVRKNDLNHPGRTNSESVGGGGTEWAGWFQFDKDGEKLDNVYIPFLVDMFEKTMRLLPPEERGELGISWFPTLTLAIEFKFPIRSLTTEHSQQTAGLYARNRFINNPQGRHDIYVEAWSAPSNIGEGAPFPGWRDKQICLAIATQVALTVPIAKNLKNAKESKL